MVEQSMLIVGGGPAGIMAGLLFARAGRTYSPVSGELVQKHEVQDVVDYISKLKNIKLNQQFDLLKPTKRKSLRPNHHHN